MFFATSTHDVASVTIKNDHDVVEMITSQTLVKTVKNIMQNNKTVSGISKKITTLSWILINNIAWIMEISKQNKVSLW